MCDPVWHLQPDSCKPWAAGLEDTHCDVVGVYVAVFLLTPSPPEADAALRICKMSQVLPRD